MAILDRIRGQFVDSTNFRKFLTDMGTVIDNLSTTIENIRTKTDIDNAETEQIDRNGEMLGINRNGLTDTEYKVLQAIKVKANRSDGTPQVIIDIAEDLAQLTTADGGAPDPIPTEGQEMFPARFRINLTTTIQTSFLNLFRNIIDQSRGAGIGSQVVHGGGVNDGGNAFSYDVGPGYDSGNYTGVI